VYYFLLAILILDAFLLMAVVLLQAGKGGGLAAMGGGGGGDTLLGGRQAVTLLTKATWWAGGLFLVLSLVLSMMSRGVGRVDPVLRDLQGPRTAAPAALPGIAEPTQPTSGQLTPGAPDVQTAPSPEPAAPQPQNP
jgi:preprotein translocase subunit SecG